MPQLSPITEDAVLALCRIHDKQGIEAFDAAARNLFMSVGSLIGHVAGPNRLVDLICIIAPDPVN
ncbi:MAG: hypothetical protein J0H38_14205 [Rhizobiales bacterium]|nr:hypothetical protein [Hyphomicrobiales bacterium]